MVRAFCIVFGLLPQALAGDAASLMQMEKLHMSNSELEASVHQINRQIHQVMRAMPDIVRASDAIAESTHGHDLIFDALRNATRSPPSTKNPFHELEKRIDTAMLENGAIHQMKDIARRGATSDVVGFLGMDTMNFGLARSGSPWYYPFMSSEKFDSFFVHLIGGVSTFVNVKIVSDTSASSPQVMWGSWRECFSLGGSLSFFLSKDTFKGSEFGGEDFYFGWQVSSRVPGWSYAISINNDYTVNKYSKFALKHEKEKIERDNRPWGPRAILSRVSGGLEFTSRNQFIGVNIQYCVMGRSQGGDCLERTDQAQAQGIKAAAEKLRGIAPTKEVEDEAKDVQANEDEEEEIRPKDVKFGEKEPKTVDTSKSLPAPKLQELPVSQPLPRPGRKLPAQDGGLPSTDLPRLSLLDVHGSEEGFPPMFVPFNPNSISRAVPDSVKLKAAKSMKYVWDSIVGTTIEGGVGHCWCSAWKSNNDIASW